MSIDKVELIALMIHIKKNTFLGSTKAKRSCVNGQNNNNNNPKSSQAAPSQNSK